MKSETAVEVFHQAAAAPTCNRVMSACQYRQARLLWDKHSWEQQPVWGAPQEELEPRDTAFVKEIKHGDALTGSCSASTDQTRAAPPASGGSRFPGQAHPRAAACSEGTAVRAWAPKLLRL